MYFLVSSLLIEYSDYGWDQLAEKHSELHVGRSVADLEFSERGCCYIIAREARVKTFATTPTFH